MKIAVFADAHLSSFENTSQLAALRYAVRRIREEKPDAAVSLGDATAFGRREAALLFRKETAELPCPKLFLAGNSDLRAGDGEVRGLVSEGKVLELGGWRLVGLDTSEGRLREEDEPLLEGDLSHSLVFLHHSPSGSCGEREREKLSRAAAVVYGHWHYAKREGKEIAVRALDPDRPVHYEGVQNDYRYPETSDIESSMYTPAAQIEEYLKTHRGKPYITCEYAHAMGNSCGAIHKYTELTEREELYQGGFIWDYIDQSLTRRDRNGKEFQAYGGDFGERPCDYTFSGNGIVYGKDRDPSPKMQEVKYVYQNIKVTLLLDGREGSAFAPADIEEGAEGCISAVIWNKNLFVNTDTYAGVIEIARDGEKIAEKTVETAAAPLSEETVVLPVTLPEEPGEYTVTLSFRLREDTIWAKAGHEVAYGQLVAYRKGGQAALLCEAAGASEPEDRAAGSGGKLIVEHGWLNTGVRGDDFEVLFSGLFGGLVSYRFGGRELIKEMPRPNFWRAMTDNDTANLLPFRAGAWKGAGMFATTKTEHGRGGTPYEIQELPGRVDVTFIYHLPVNPAKDCRVTYSVFPDGEIRVHAVLEKSADVGQLPEFSMLFTMDASYDHLEWYGLGPEETYPDRCHAKLGIYRNMVSDNMAKYLVPQECGNKQAVRRAKVTDAFGAGMLFKAQGLGVCVLPWTPQELDQARHPNELADPLYTYVRVGVQMGVGGDDTWGALVHPEYLLDNSREMEITFSFRGI